MTFGDGRLEMIRRLRLGNLRRLFRNRYGPILPDDDAGREDLHEFLLPISVGPNADIKMPNAVEVWAPWMGRDETAQLIDRINLTPIWQRKPSPKPRQGWGRHYPAPIMAAIRPQVVITNSFLNCCVSWVQQGSGSTLDLAMIEGSPCRG
jgi:hypothetical protein